MMKIAVLLVVISYVYGEVMKLFFNNIENKLISTVIILIVFENTLRIKIKNGS